MLSDPVDLDVPDLAEMLVTMFVPRGIPAVPGADTALLKTEDDAVMAERLMNATPATGRPLINAVLVRPRKPTAVIVALGDSITDGHRAVADQPHGWVAALSARLAGERSAPRLAAVTAGINANRLLRPGAGAAGLARADSDVFMVPGIRHLIVFEGINDIGLSGPIPAMGMNSPLVAADEITSGLSQLAARSHARGVKIFVGTLLPFRGAFYFSEEKEAVRQAVNTWIRNSHEFDGVIDFEQTLRDPDHPDVLNPRYDSGDHLHPNETGHKAMAAAISLGNFR